MTNFVVANWNGCSFALPSTASTMELHKTAAESCDVSFPFAIELSTGEVIASSNQSISEHPDIVTVAKILGDIWDGASFRIPLNMYPLSKSESDLSVFKSLVRVFGGPGSNVHTFAWYQWILQCIYIESCSVLELCDRFRNFFGCSNDGKLTGIYLKAEKMKTFLDLSALPASVELFTAARYSLTEIKGLDKLSGKQLRCLDVRRNPGLQIDLEPLTRSSPRSTGNPLRFLCADGVQISRSLIGDDFQSENPKRQDKHNKGLHRLAEKWVKTSVLNRLVMGRNRDHCRSVLEKRGPEGYSRE